MPRKLLISALLLVIPFSGMRVICLERAPERGATVHVAGEADCDQICAVRPGTGANGSECALMADASALIVFAAAAVLPSQQPMRAPAAVLVEATEASDFYLEPGLAHLSPPPRA